MRYKPSSVIPEPSKLYERIKYVDDRNKYPFVVEVREELERLLETIDRLREDAYRNSRY